MPSALANLIARGYLPKELPPPFSTTTLAVAVDRGLPNIFDLLLTRPTRAHPAYVSVPAVHNLARAGTLRRKLGIPNPVNQFQLTKEIVGGWKEIARISRQSKISLTSPSYSKKPGDRAIKPANPFNAIPAARMHTRAGSRFILSTDLNAFYPSIYTHSIPWAIHGKAIAKARRTDMSLLGNRLDLAIRNGQGQQTVGIAIGPDTSLVIAELLGSRVDETLSNHVQENGFRYIDDFECGFMSTSEAEAALATIQNEFSKFELNLNPRKTRIVELPQAIEAFWVPHLRLFPITTRGMKSQRTELLGFFGRAFELAKEYREEAILKYAIQRMSSVRIFEDNWQLYEDILLGCVSIESGVTPVVVAEFLRYRSTHPLNRKRITSTFERLIRYHSPMHHGSEVCWSIWLLGQLGIGISFESATAALGIGDPIVTLCLLHSRSLGLVGPGVNWSIAERQMTTDELYGPQWLLSYEASIKGWLPSHIAADHIAASPHFSHLRAEGVSFYELHASLPIRPVTAPAVGAGDSDFDDLTEGESDDDDEDEDDSDDFGISG